MAVALPKSTAQIGAIVTLPVYPCRCLSELASQLADVDPALRAVLMMRGDLNDAQMIFCRYGVAGYPPAKIGGGSKESADTTQNDARVTPEVDSPGGQHPARLEPAPAANVTTLERVLSEVKAAHENGTRPRVHGNGFVQLDLSPSRRLHVWGDPRVPRQTVPTQIHDYTFSFTSTVIRGQIINRTIRVREDGLGAYRLYTAEVNQGEDTRLVRNDDRRYRATISVEELLEEGAIYTVDAGRFHETVAPWLCVTVIEKDGPTLAQGGPSPRVLVPVDLEPDNTFNRYSTPADVLWQIIYKALGSERATDNLTFEPGTLNMLASRRLADAGLNVSTFYAQGVWSGFLNTLDPTSPHYVLDVNERAKCVRRALDHLDQYIENRCPKPQLPLESNPAIVTEFRVMGLELHKCHSYTNVNDADRLIGWSICQFTFCKRRFDLAYPLGLPEPNHHEGTRGHHER